MSCILRRVAATTIAVALGTALLSAQDPAVYTAAQAEAGNTAYQARCASCHTADLGGRQEFPQLAGADFISSWGTRTTKDLYSFINMTMPPEGPQLSPEQTVEIVALMLRQNGAPAGSTALTPTTAVEIGKIATGKRPVLALSAAHIAAASRP